MEQQILRMVIEVDSLATKGPVSVVIVETIPRNLVLVPAIRCILEKNNFILIHTEDTTYFLREWKDDDDTRYPANARKLHRLYEILRKKVEPRHIKVITGTQTLIPHVETPEWRESPMPWDVNIMARSDVDRARQRSVLERVDRDMVRWAEPKNGRRAMRTVEELRSEYTRLASPQFRARPCCRRIKS